MTAYTYIPIVERMTSEDPAKIEEKNAQHLADAHHFAKAGFVLSARRSLRAMQPRLPRKEQQIIISTAKRNRDRLPAGMGF